MATDVSPSLIRSLRRGSVRTAVLPAGEPPVGVFTEDEGPADGQMAAIGLNADNDAGSNSSDGVFDAFFGGGDSASDSLAALPEPAAVSGEDPGAESGRRAADTEVAASHAATPSAPKSSRAQRFKSAGGVVTTPVPPAEAAKMPEAPATGSVRSWSRFVDPNDRKEAVSARQAMAAAKVLTPLVAAVSFAPGSQSGGQPKSKALTEMLVGVHRCAVATAETISEHMGKDVPSWMVTQLMQSLSHVISKRWEAGAGVDVDALVSNMRSLFGQSAAEVNDLVLGASEDTYVEVDHPDIVRFRVSVSAANAAWVLYDWVTHPRLSLDEKGDMPSRFFTFQQPTSSIVNKMLARCVSECRGLVAQVESADLRTAHMQASIARMANLIGSEYVTRTRHVMNWIGDPDISDDEYQARLDAAVNELDTRLLPEIYEHARVSFLSIEQGAFRTIEDLYEKTNSELVPGGNNSRPSS